MKVSVIMSAFNEEIEYIQLAIDSILNQTFKDFEFIIILDNPSNETLKKYLISRKQEDCRIKFYANEKNIGLANCLNKGISLAKGDLICRMDADDISLPNRLEIQVKKFMENPNLVVLSGSVIKIDDNGNMIKKCIYRLNSKKINKILLEADVIIHPSVMFDKEKIKNIGNYRNFPTAQDFDLWLRCISAGYSIEIIEDIVLYYRIRNNSITSTKALMQWLTHEYIIGLYRERKKIGKDTFSPKKYQIFLENKGFNEKSKDKFNNGLKYLEKIKENLKKKNILNLFSNIMHLIFSHKEMVPYIRYILRLSKFQSKN